MHTYNLGFISDSDIFQHVKNTVEQYRVAIDLAEFNQNLIDPIKLTFDAKVYGKSFEDIIESESSVFSELAAVSTDTFKSLYLLAFRTYEGFDLF